jgi:exopolysaccharide biosynthesis polyprenyl glycosylphosphotransferase
METTQRTTVRERGLRKGWSEQLLWMVADVATIAVASILATFVRFHITPLDQARELLTGTLSQDMPLNLVLAMPVFFSVALILVSRRSHLYEPMRITTVLEEQRLSLEACLISGLLLTGALYLVRAYRIPRTVVLMTVILVTVGLGLRRLLYRMALNRRFEQGVGTRNVLIVGTGEEAQALRQHIEKIPHLGYTFKGFVEVPGSGEGGVPGQVVGTLDTLFDDARKQFVDEILFTSHCDRKTIEPVLIRARERGVDLRVIPDLYGGLAWNSPVEYIGQFPTIPLHSGRVPEAGLIVKRGFDMVFSTLTILLLLPLFAVIALAVKLDSPGRVFYLSDRIGKKGRVFRCLKFRTMVSDADQRKRDLMEMNERDGVLFKISNDPRVTRVGRLLRKYSLDELPQFWNVLKGEMSVVGPRPPLAGEVKEYKLNHLRRLDVLPGITGLWQVQGRRDPSFASYVSLDVTYIDNWSVWLDFQIILKTIFVVLSGTGT